MLLLLACAEPAVDINVSPDQLDFGEVQFTAEMPDEGFAQEEVVLTNASERETVLTLPPYDDDHLCIEGFDNDQLPQDLTSMTHQATYVLRVGICGYIPGEADSEVALTLTVQTDGTPSTVEIPITFTPIRVTE